MHGVLLSTKNLAAKVFLREVSEPGVTLHVLPLKTNNCDAASSQPSQRVFHPDSPTGRVSVRETGDVAMTLSFPAGLAAFSRVSIEFTPQGTRIFGPSFEVHNEHAPSPSRTNRSRGARINVQPSANSTPSRRTPIIVEAHDLPENNALTHAVELLAVVDEPIVEQSVVDSSDSDSDNEPEVMPAAFTLDDIPDPVYPRVGRQKGPREPLPMNPTGAESYWVVLRGFKIGIFLEAWYV